MASAVGNAKHVSNRRTDHERGRDDRPPQRLKAMWEHLGRQGPTNARNNQVDHCLLCWMRLKAGNAGGLPEGEEDMYGGVGDGMRRGRGRREGRVDWWGLMRDTWSTGQRWSCSVVKDRAREA